MPIQTETRSPEMLGPYTLIREIGRGGMSVVHQAVDRRTGKTVALKAYTVPPSLSSSERNAVMVRFAREARTVARLSHPGVVAIHEVGEHEGTHFLAMEYLEGQTLCDRLKAGPLTPSQAAPILSQVADAVDAVHAAGIVHRDIKPKNVMLLPEGGVKLLDFGVARQSEDTTVTAAHSIVGSPTYMAPEQVRGELGDAASDRWALGVLLYEMLAGRPPFAGANIPSVLFQVVHEEPAPGVPVSVPVQRVLRHALEKDPHRRYPTARALAVALQDAARPLSTPAWDIRAWRWVPWVAVLAVGTALGVGVVMVRNERPPARSEAALRLPAAVPPPAMLPTFPAIEVAAPPLLYSHRARRSPTHRPHPAKARQAPRPQARVAAGRPVMAAPPAPSRRQRHIRARTTPAVNTDDKRLQPRLPATQPVWLHRPVSRPTSKKQHLPPHPAYVSLAPSPPLPDTMSKSSPPTAPATPLSSLKKDKDADEQRTRDLEKFIWSEGR